MKNKRRTALGFKIYNLIIILVFASACLSIFVCYREYIRTTDEIYLDLAGNVAETVRNSLNGGQVKALVEASMTDECREALDEALASQDNTAVREYLMSRDLLRTYEDVNDVVVQYTRYMDVKYIYIINVEDGFLRYVIDPDDPYFTFGVTEPLAGVIRSYSGSSTDVLSELDRTPEGLLLTAYRPVYDLDGNAAAVLGVDIDMEPLRRSQRASAFKSIINALVLATIAAVGGVFFMRQNVTGPLRKLSLETRKFSEKKGLYSKESIIDLNIHSRDEIEDLYLEIREMEKRIVESLEHLVKVTGEKERINTELRIAAQMQADMLPLDFPAFPDRQDFDLYASMDPAREVGGDFYDFFLLDDDHLVLTIADVSGKGVPAALFMAITKSLLKVNMHSGDSPSVSLTKLNDLICKSNKTSMFVSVWLGVLELSTGILTVSNAGHEYPAISRAGSPFELFKDKHDLVLAAMGGIQYSEYRIVLQPGDRLFLYTDGVPEATDNDNHLFGLKRMTDSLNQAPDAGPQELILNMMESINDFVDGAPQFDDITMLALTYKP